MDQGQLTYYEYWLTKDSWPLEFAMSMVFNYYAMGRMYDSFDVFNEIVDGFKQRMRRMLLDASSDSVFYKKVVVSFEANSESVSHVYRLNTSECAVKPKEFIQWLYENNYHLPYEFKLFIGVQEEVISLREKQQEYVDKMVCQGIGRTLWDEYSTMTSEDMRDHKAIQIYGSGRLYSRDTTLARWLREVDPRENKRGPKPKP